MSSTAVSALPPSIATSLPAVIAACAEALGANLQSVMVYGSAARGDFNPTESDINLLIILASSNPNAQEVLGRVLGDSGLRITPFVLGVPGLARSLSAFAPKFMSIRRTSLLLHGADLISQIPEDETQLRFLIEQALRNHRLRAVHAFMASGGDGVAYGRWLAGAAGRILTELSNATRLCGVEVGGQQTARLAAIATCFALDVADLEALYAAKHGLGELKLADVQKWHRRVFGLLEQTVQALEARWPQ